MREDRRQMAGGGFRNGPRITGRRALPILAVVFFGIGLLGLAAGASAYWLERESARSAKTGGSLVKAGYNPLVQFTTESGTVVQFTSSVRSSFWKAGDAVDVAYDPANPGNAAIDGLAGRWLLAALFAGLGCLFALIGLGLGLLSRLLPVRQP